MTLDLSDPQTWLIGGAIALALIVLLLILGLARASRAAKAAEAMAGALTGVTQQVQHLGAGQQQLFGGLNAVTEAQAQQQQRTLQLMEARLKEVTEATNQTLQRQTKATAHSLGELQQRLRVIDRAQENITKLSGDVLGLQDILSNKQRRGMFGEIQLHDLVSKALPSDAFKMQATLSNGKRADCLIKLPDPPGPIVVDAKFPLEDFEAYVAAETQEARDRALKAFGAAVRVHIKAIAERYIVEGETADGALMFLPSEAIYAELHARLPQVVREGFEARVWIVSPTTCMATLNTMRAILKDARMREQAGAIRRELSLLYADVDRLGTRVENLDRHFGQAAKDIADIKISADKAGKRARRLDRFDFEELAPEEDQPVPLKLTTNDRA